ncbi:MAG: HNH endonuclease [Candidatus Sulfotelmatobacter sp.]
MAEEQKRFTIRASASRLDKGLLAIPQKFRELFPGSRTHIHVVFDDGQKVKEVTFQPYDSVVKENRIFGLRQWFSARGVREGDLISVTVEDKARGLYRIALDRFVRERAEQRARLGLQGARTDAQAEEQLTVLSHLTSRRPRETAREELLRIAEQLPHMPRPTVLPRMAERHEVVSSAIRVLLRELHDGKCQLCSFTFEKKGGEPYFEVHHVEARVGHHPQNLLVVCPNCHAQLEHAEVDLLERHDGWLVAVTINGKRIAVRQPLVSESHWKALLGLTILIAAIRMGRFLAR